MVDDKNLPVEKKPYEAPSLTDLGRLIDLTKSKGDVGADLAEQAS